MGGDCGNCDAANSLGGAPRKLLPPPTLWFNKSAWDRVNRMAAATNMEIIFGTAIPTDTHTHTEREREREREREPARAMSLRLPYILCQCLFQA